MKRLALAVAVASLAATSAFAEVSVKLGVLNDRSGLFADITGAGSVVATQMAVEDFQRAGGKVKADVIFADHQNKPDIGLTIARRWYDQDGVDAIVDVPGSAIALAIADLSIERGKILLSTSSGASQISGSACSTNTVQWAYDTWSQAHSVGKAAVAAGGDSWFIITADYAFGHALEADLVAAVKEAGGTIAGSVRAPLGTPDFSSFLLRAQASKAKIIGLALAGVDLINVIKQSNEFGLTASGQSIATPIMFISDVKSLGLNVAQGLLLGAPFYWDLNDETRAWSKRFTERHEGKMPTFLQGAVYSVVLHYLKAVEAAGTKDATQIMARMLELKTEDPIFGTGTLAVNRRHEHPLHLFRVKTPAESTGEWDFFKLVSTVPADKAVKPLDQTGCKLVK